jgi:hypothetical protein
VDLRDDYNHGTSSEGATGKGKIMTREEAFARCNPDSYVEFYGGRWLVVPLAPVEQPLFFNCSPKTLRNSFLA